jgi:hypothetical protein
MKEYLVIFSNDNKILFQDEIGIVSPEEVLDLLFNDKAQVDKEERIDEVPNGDKFLFFHSRKYTIKQIVE